MTIHPGRTIPVMALPGIDPEKRRDLTLPEGLTVEAIVMAALPAASESDLKHCRVTLINERGMIVIERANWRLVRPKPGARVLIRIVPSGNLVRSLLQIVVSIAAVALGQYWALGLGFIAGTTGFAIASGLIGIGLTVLGNLLINALIPPPKPKQRDQERRETYQISGWQNRLDPNGVVPEVLGTIRFAPPFAAPPYTEIIGDEQYIRAAFNFGAGPLHIRDPRLGDTSIEEYDEVETEIRQGLPGDAPLSLYPRQVIEENVGAELTRPYPRNDAGSVIPGGTPVATPVTRTTGADAAGASVIISFPAGLVYIDDEGNYRSRTVAVKISQRLAGTTTWADVVTLNVTANKSEGFHRQHSWDFPSRGKWDVQVERITPEDTSTRVQSRSVWSALQTIRPEYPLALVKPTGLVAMRIKATHQLNGQLDNFNALASRLCPDWDAATKTWITRETSSPASIFRLALQSPANPKAVANSEIDLDQLADFHAFCLARNLKYDAVLEADTELREKLTEIAVAGRAAPRHDGVKWGVIIDRPQTLPVDHISSRNSWNFQSRRQYIKPPHAFRVQFLDATNDYKPAERLVPWPGHAGEITLTEALELPGKTDPDEIWIEARRRMYEALNRLDVYTCIQGGAARTATRGDLVMLNTDVLERQVASARVKSVDANLVELDNGVTMEAGGSYALRFRVYEDAKDTIGISVVRPVMTVEGDHFALVMTGAGSQKPIVGDIVHFGPAAVESLPVVITRSEAGSQMSTFFRMADAAPIIDELTDGEIPPFWDGRVGEEIGDGGTAPPTPRFTSVRTGLSGAGAAGSIAVTLSPGTGAGSAAIFRVEHREVGAPGWSHVDFPVADGGVTIAGYATGDDVELRAIAYSSGGTPSAAYTPIVTVTVGAADAAIPAALDDGTVTVGALLGGAVIQFQTTADTATRNIRLWHAASPTLDQNTDRIVTTAAVQPSRSYSAPDGDTTRANLLPNGSFDNATGLVLGDDWSVAGGVATHVAGSASSQLGQALAMTAGKYYRIGFTLSDVAAGSLLPRLTGGTAVDGTARLSDGLYSDRLQAVSGNTGFALVASASAELSVDNAFVFLETTTSLAAGTHYYFLEPLNADGVPGPISGPHAVTIR